MMVKEIIVEERGRRKSFTFSMACGAEVSFTTELRCFHSDGIVAESGFVSDHKIRQIKRVGDQFYLIFRNTEDNVSVHGRLIGVMHEGGVKTNRYIVQ